MTDTRGKRLAQARREYGVREERDVTGPDVAAMIGVSASAYYNWEADQKWPRSDTVAELARLLGVTPGWLDYGQPPKLAPGVAPLGGDPLEIINPAADRRLTDEEIERAKRTAAQRRAAKQPRKREKGA